MARLQMRRGRRESGRVALLAALALVACSCLLACAFVSPPWRAPAPRGQSVVAARSTGEYTGFVPDMQRRMLMN
eukprot:CAMPEP_0168402940 /NCGR_PEP_ID=MMETSP0228-20121227/23873_1 /TAXON_ID=133427 /ORGANISM="Protoceratium reticulatum, Strain CCCM 535 (=CCMP 1889)" /LENGTH=73 /DNA_ID=CAMNT_0008416529 /DNA_START=18 /DNA_END=236 /DNA_ORIENTATION=-